MKLRNGLLAAGAVLALCLTGCASAPDYNGTDDSSEDESITEETEDQWSYENTDLNSKYISGDNGVATITVTLNNGDTVECVSFDSTLECFPETYATAAPR